MWYILYAKQKTPGVKKWGQFGGINWLSYSYPRLKIGYQGFLSSLLAAM